eukprot:g2610.t1
MLSAALRTVFMSPEEVRRLGDAKAHHEKGRVVRSAKDLPSSTEPAAKIRVYFVECRIGGTATEVLQLRHNGLVFEEEEEEEEGAAEGGRQRPIFGALQYFGCEFGPSVFIPRVVQEAAASDDDDDDDDAPASAATAATATTLEWRNDSIVVFSPGVGADSPKWDVGRHLIGTITGAQWNTFAATFVAPYASRHPGYQPFDVVDPGTGKILLRSAKCSEFAAEGICQLHRLGLADVDPSVPPVLYTNIVPLVAASPPTVVDLADEAQAQAVAKHYRELALLAGRVSVQGTPGLPTITAGEASAAAAAGPAGPAGPGARDQAAAAGVAQTITLPDLLRMLASNLSSWYIFDRERQVYLRTPLAAPYVRLDLLRVPLPVPWKSTGYYSDDDDEAERSEDGTDDDGSNSTSNGDDHGSDDGTNMLRQLIRTGRHGHGRRPRSAASVLGALGRLIVRRTKERLPSLLVSDRLHSLISAATLGALGAAVAVPAWLCVSKLPASWPPVSHLGTWAAGFATGGILVPLLAVTAALKQVKRRSNRRPS